MTSLDSLSGVVRANVGLEWLKREGWAHGKGHEETC